MLNYDVRPFISELKDFENALIETYSFVQTLGPEELSYIKKLSRASMIGGSTRIENAQLTDMEVHWLDIILETESKVTAFQANRHLIEDKLSKDRERSYEEVAGCRAMLNLIFDEGKDWVPLRESDLRSLHAILLKPYSKAGPYIGQYKVQPNYVVEFNQLTKESRTVFKTADAGPITTVAMRDLLVWYNQAIQECSWPVAIACEFVFRFLAIHPFQDGNGRLGRGLFVLTLLQANHVALKQVVPLIAIDRHIERRKEEYYFTLNRCSNGLFQENPKDYQIVHFFRFMLKVLYDALKDVTIYHQRYVDIQKLSESAHKVYNCFQNFPELRLVNKKIAMETQLPSRTVAYCLAQLTDLGLIQKYGNGAGVRYQMTF
jgi:Fic family protein